MGTNREKMINGEPYLPADPELDADRRRGWREMARFNAHDPEDLDGMYGILKGFVAEIGENSTFMQRLQIEYGYNTRIGANSFMNYDGIILDCGPVTIGDHVMMGPRVQLLTALHPVEDHDARIEGWETTAPIVIGDKVWFGGGVIVCPGVTIGNNTVVGAGSVVTRDLPAHVLAVGNPARVVRKI
ncbi:sugar O-acetyltransferase [Lentzea sp. BCCO 10_0798]|jgi:maltose O-acetyltransferase|uniref:Sugar O-acetyltransferase n=1 Tax=Lentzea kristufekii TaxID=3095430 RepID=A0ABU4TIW7_9PSEU|nr:sugar O-acetyltransferase [Lentzea sp. BCCO 10_0798]MDX8048219.1 sugar O-acetyltransferase [Lentzea sp. BCCO 10_0798]